jgi:hypothetical protein
VLEQMGLAGTWKRTSKCLFTVGRDALEGLLSKREPFLDQFGGMLAFEELVLPRVRRVRGQGHKLSLAQIRGKT